MGGASLKPMAAVVFTGTVDSGYMRSTLRGGDVADVRCKELQNTSTTGILSQEVENMAKMVGYKRD
jgi:hypothetical protein